MVHGYFPGNVLKAFSEPHRNEIRSVKGGNKFPHELFITVPVTFKHRVWVEGTMFGWVLWDKYVVTYLDCIILEQTDS